MQVTVRGDGIAARCCARLLEGAGLGVTMDFSERAKIPAIMIGATTQGLFADAFGRPDLFEDARPIAKRIVAWGADAPPRTIPHAAVVASESGLLARLPAPAAISAPDGAADWSIFASDPPPACEIHSFGDRTAQAVEVRLNPDADRSACWVESLSEGWLFLIPGPGEPGWLLAVGGEHAAMLDASRLVRAQICATGPAAEFPAHPRIAWPLCAPGWVACGSGALAFDPLCGDGAGNAVREAILAGAVVRAAGRGEPLPDLMAHYRARLLAALQRHLDVCAEFYRTGGDGPWWRAQLEAIREGRAWCARELRDGLPARYQLRGFDLQPIPRPRAVF